MPKAVILFTTVALIAALALAGLYLMFALSPVATDLAPAEPIQVLIHKGDGFSEISRVLFEKDIIRSARAFRFYSLLSGSAHRLKPGSYDFSPSLGTTEIVAALVRGPNPDIQVLITEGETILDIEERLVSRGIIAEGALTTFPFASLIGEYPFLRGAQSLEGFLFPDTYRFYFDSPVETTIKILLDNFKKRALPVITRNTKKILETLTIASMIEKEVSKSDDRLLVSGVIAKRLKIGMALQIDATRDYARKISDDRYDTYAYAGLPAGPIANPGLDAISAALHPQNSPYLYYLSDPKTGTTYFSKTFEEHDTLRAKYINIAP